ncbi:hypothetical protein BCR33DRAFT_710976 [Rhizoclosmatium globosum]|uniref:Uncharacterized protein n=1 Tax=Rhizoclosmatium globosum TaxID=329046 RepID=A0A1Y2D2P7_9FUNG|nr:hypothetical protein BCR33DRAFT_710976 [Rhizoclosmatium globosum]|eukprot:ORY53573.1 hypothetical protein BCR33DRAFT_710976 [Rhizoclosmatium globosum]
MDHPTASSVFPFTFSFTATQPQNEKGQTTTPPASSVIPKLQPLLTRPHPLWVPEPSICQLPVISPIHLQPPIHTIPRQAHDIQETEALAKLAIGTIKRPLDITLQSTFERLVALAGSREFLPVAAKVRHYLTSVAFKRREWCCEFCTKPYIGNSGEGLFGRVGRDGMVCGGTYIVPPAILRGIDVEHRQAMDQLKTHMNEFPELHISNQFLSSAHLNRSSAPTSTHNTGAPSFTQPMPYQTINVSSNIEIPRSCCSVDTTVFNLLGVSNIFNKPTEHIYDTTPTWLNSVYGAHHDNCYYKAQREMQLSRNQEQASLRFQAQRERVMNQQNQFELFYQTLQQQQQQQQQMAAAVSKIGQQQQTQPQMLNSNNIFGLGIMDSALFQPTLLNSATINTSTSNKRPKLDDPFSFLLPQSQQQQQQQQSFLFADPLSQLKFNMAPSTGSRNTANSMTDAALQSSLNQLDALPRATSSSVLSNDGSVDGNMANAARAAES